MKKILFLRSERAFLPEIDAYIQYFNKTRDFKAYDSSNIKGEFQLKDFDIIWEFKGFGGVRTKEHLIIHEYASLSTGFSAKIKDLLKSKLNPKPDIRVFLNENVKNGFSFNDNIEYCYRDMGIDSSFLKEGNGNNKKKEYDFVYVGSITKEREIDKLLFKFNEKHIGKLCLVGNVDDEIYNQYKNNKDIIFTGKVPYSEIPNIASKAEFGLNYIPDKYPFNIQTSTKLLEYLALGLKIISTDYKWIREFEKKHGCSFYKLDYKNFIFDREQINKFNYKSNFNTNDFLWDNIIDKSGIKDLIRGKIL